MIINGTFACALLVAIASSGCNGQSASGPPVSIHVVLPQAGPLAERGNDMLIAVNIAVEQTGGIEGGRRVVVERSSARTTRDALRASHDALADDRAVATIGGVDNRVTFAMSRLLPELGLLHVAPVSLGTASSRGEKSGTKYGTISTAPLLATIGSATATASLEKVDEVTVWPMPAATRKGFDETASRNGLVTNPKAGSRRCSPTAAGVESAGSGITRAKIFCEGQVYLSADDAEGAYEPWNGYGGNGYLVTPALAYEDLPPAGRRFYDEFRQREGRWPDRWAIFAYEAAGLVLQSIKDAQAETGEVSRKSVRDAAFAIRSRFGPIGRYDVLPNGQTTLNTVAVRRLPLPAGPENEREPADDQVIEVAE
jgi:ABC-type branched-subunit amino acid transport system substrate-binding protein